MNLGSRNYPHPPTTSLQLGFSVRIALNVPRIRTPGAIMSNHYRVLLVEDNPTFAQLAKGLLSLQRLVEAYDASFQVDHASDLAEAVTFLRKDNYDAILLNLFLPDAQGMEGLLELKKLRPDLPVIVLTADSDPKICRLAISKGAEQFLYKKHLETSAAAGDLLVHGILRAIDQTAIDRLQNHWLSAEVIQRRLTPAPLEVDGLEFGGECHPIETFGGDFYYWAKLPDGRIMFLVADAIGHDLAAAIAMVGLAKFVRSYCRHSSDLREILAAVNLDLYNDFKDEKANEAPGHAQMNKFVCVLAAAIDPQTLELEFYGAGQNAFLVRCDGSAKELEAVGPPLGITEDGFDFPDCPKIQLDPGDVFAIVTDGVPEARDMDQTEFGIQALLDQMVRTMKEPAESIAAELCCAAREHAQPSPLNDDCTVIVVKIQPKS